MNIIPKLSKKIICLQYERKNLSEALLCFQKSYKMSESRKVRSALNSQIISLSNRIGEFDRVMSILGIKDEVMSYEI